MSVHQKPITVVLFFLVAVLISFPAFLSADQTENPDKKTIVDLIEKNIPRAYGFTIESPVLLPDFSALDQLAVGWDKGDPDKARADWLALQYVAYEIDYTVDSVFFFSPYTARVEGEKKIAYKTLCRWAQTCMCDAKRYSSFLWTDLAGRKRQCTQCWSKKGYFTITAQKSPDGVWQLVSETVVKKKPKTNDKKKKKKKE